MRFLDYYEKYPDLILSILEYFWFDADFNKKTILGFCTHNKYNEGHTIAIQPYVVLKICDILADNSILSLNFRGGAMDGKTSYSFVWRKEKDEWDRTKNVLLHHYNSLVYGFEYIYQFYSDKVLPIVASKNGDSAMGTVFKFHFGLVTARHCIEKYDTYSIKGYSAEQLKSSQIYVSKDENIDVAYIDLGEHIDIYCEEPNVLDDILVMGYPKVPAFLDFLTAEKATISSMSKLRMTTTRGSISAKAKTIYTKEQELMLITAKIKGGNSGGPIINNKGCVIGVAFGAPESEGMYDDVGYGVGMPIQVLNDILSENNTVSVNFVDWSEE